MSLFSLNIFGFTLSPSIYGFMYALSFILGYWIIKKRSFFTSKQLEDLFFYVFIGVVVGGRLGYTLFYNFDYYIHNVGDILKVWEGGMSFHGGVLGVIIMMYLFSKKHRLNFYKISDEVCAILPIGLGLGRIGNYSNGELLGFSGYNGFLSININGVGYFPSTLLEAFLEGFILYIILFFIYKSRKFAGQISALFLIFYGIFRLIVELFFRQPDSHIGYIFSVFSTGSLLTLPMIIAGIIYYIILQNKK